MQCVRCYSQMDKSTRDGVVIDICNECNGIWLDNDEIETLANGDEERSTATLLAEAKKELIEEKSQTATRIWLCPKCQKAPLTEQNFNDVNLDICPSCGGVFFDEGELETILENDGLALSIYIKEHVCTV